VSRTPAGNDPVEFAGTARFQVLRRLGAGGMGVVYEALDRERNVHVALKTLRSFQPDALFRLKNEFRRLQDIQHPGLVNLGELHSEGGHWFFTMELIAGVDFLSWVRPSSTGEPWKDHEISPSAETIAPWSDNPPSPRPQLHRPSLDLARLRGALVRLAQGLSALHSAGKVHRDIKPSNVLCCLDGRVVLLDFGLAIDTGQPGASDVNVVGTADYMAPEQAASRPVGPPADWYAVGVMLYEALTTRLPFPGAPIEVLLSKQRLKPPAPNLVATGVPDDLNDLCVRLLHMESDARPDGEEVLQLIGAGDEIEPQRSPTATAAAAPFIGRERELNTLREAFETTRDGKTMTVLVSGESGVGKTALVRRFAEQVRAEHPAAVILSGRCYERESVPYKALDGVIDSLARYLTKLSRPAAAALLPLRVDLLAQVFPVLGRVPAVMEAPSLKGPTLDPQELRARVFGALRELFARICERHPAALVIDDLQWADADSLMLLADLREPPDVPPLLVVATARATQESLSGIGGIAFAGAKHVHVARLPPDEACQLAVMVMKRIDGGTLPEDDARAIARESGGHPLFIDELVRHMLQPSGDTAPGGHLHLDGALWARVRQLDDNALLLLQLCAVAGTPLPEEAAARAMDVGPAELIKHLSLLRASNLVRTGLGQSASIEPYHDRVREALLAHLTPPDIQALHARLARALETLPGIDSEVLFNHFRGAGDPARAAQYAAKAADQAHRALAFSRAARLYKQSIDLGGGSGPGAVALRMKLGEALGCIGRSGDAALAYLDAARHAHGAEALDLQRRGAEKLLVSGHIDEGLDGLGTVLRSVGLKLAESPRQALMSLVWRRLRLKLRGLKFRERRPEDIDVAVLRRIDVCWSVAIGLGMVDPVRSMEFQTRHLLLALAAGDPYRVARALAMEAAFTATGGEPARAKTERLLDAAQVLAERIQHPHAVGLTGLARGVAAFLGGRWAESFARLDATLQILREKCVDVHWEINTCEQFSMLALTKLGELAEVQRRMPKLRKSARERGDLYAQSILRSGLLGMASLADDDPERSRQEISEAVASWSKRGFMLQHYWELTAMTACDLYVGDGRTALDRIGASWPAVERSMVLRIAYMYGDALHMRARAHLARASRLLPQDRERAPHITAATADAARIEQLTGPPLQALAIMVRASVAATQGEPERAAELCDKAIRACDETGMGLFAAICRMRRGELVGGDEGDTLRRMALQFMEAQRIKNPRRMCALFMPGFPD
jgi:eukaryotic-like serine/threonine-protein kinase